MIPDLDTIFGKESIINNSNFMRLWGSQIFSQVALHVLNFILAVSIYTQTQSSQGVSFLVISFGLAAFLFGAPAGVLVDYMNKKRTLFISTVARAGLVILLLLIIMALQINLWLIIIIAFTLNAVTQFFFPAEGASIPLLVKDKNLLTANSLFTSSLFATQLVGYISAGLILEKFGLPRSLSFLVISFLMAAYFISTLKYPKDEINKKEPQLKKVANNLFKDFKIGMQYILKSPPVQKAFLYLGLSQVLVGVFITIMPAYAVVVLDLKPQDTSIYLIGPVAIGMAAGAFLIGVFGRNRNSEKIINAAAQMAMVSFIAASCVYFISDNHAIKTTLTAALMFAIGMANALIVVINNTNLQRETTKEVRGRAYGALQTIMMVAGLLPVVIAGYLSDKIGVYFVVMGVGVFIMICHILISRIGIQKEAVPET